MDENLLELIKLLKSEFATMLSKLETVKKIAEANPLDNEIKMEIAALKERVQEIEHFKNMVEGEVLAKTRELINSSQENGLGAYLLSGYNMTSTAIYGMKSNLEKAILANILIDELAFEQAEICLKALDLSAETPEGLPGIVLEKFSKEGKKMLVSAIPFADEIIQLSEALFFMPDIEKPNLDNAIILTLRQRIIDGASKEFKISNILSEALYSWANKVYTTNELPDRKKAIILNSFGQTLTMKNITTDMDFANKANYMLVVALQELFQKANVPIIQWCAASVLNEPDPQVPVKTSFTKDEKVNKIILDTIAKIGIPITSTGALRPKYLQQLFPRIIADKNVIYVIHPDHEKSLAGELTDYAEKSPGAHYADNLKKMREQESWEEKLKKKEEEVWANAMQEKVKKEMEKEQKIYNQQKEELKAKINEKVVGDKPYGMNAGMEFQLGKVYDIGATFGVRELDKWGNLDTEAAASRLKEFAAAIKKLNPKRIVYSAFLDNAHGQKYSDVAVYTGISQFHDSICHHTGLKLSKDLDYKRIHLLSSETELAKSRLGRFLEFN